MIIKLLTICSSFILFVACNNQTQQTTQNAEPEIATTTNCYSSANNNDTVSLTIKDSNGLITGMLVYNLYQKDKNTGTLQGSMKDSLLVADYTFMSEGVQSVRQVAFKKTNNGFVEGYGEMDDKDGKMMFKNTDSLTFNNSSVLTSVDCK